MELDEPTDLHFRLSLCRSLFPRSATSLAKDSELKLYNLVFQPWWRAIDLYEI